MVEASPSDRDTLNPGDWTMLSDEKLLELRMCDLGLAIEGTELEARIAAITGELEARGVRCRPRYWLSDEWFTPDGVPGVAIPYYLAHPRLAKLELAQMLEVEGGDPDSGMPSTTPINSAGAPRGVGSSARRPRRTPSTTRPSRTARVSSSTSITGTRRAIPTRTSRKPSPSGSIRNRCGRPVTPAGRPNASCSTWTA